MDRHEIKFLLNYLENNPAYLNSLQYEFIVKLKENYRWTGVITKKQVECLNDIKGYLPFYSQKQTVHETESDKYQAQFSSFDHFTTFKI
jgi:uncharacterized protein (DUF2132 family)